MGKNRMYFAYRLEREDGSPAVPAVLQTAVPNWRPGDTIPLGAGRTLRVVGTRLKESPDGDPVPVLVVETYNRSRRKAA
jgi:hypothetical protein